MLTPRRSSGSCSTTDLTIPPPGRRSSGCAASRGVRFLRSERNLGIIEGTRLCLEHAVNRYTATVDHDDLLTPDCIRVVSHALGEAGYPALAYTDEDKLDGDRFSSCLPQTLVRSGPLRELAATSRTSASSIASWRCSSAPTPTSRRRAATIGTRSCASCLRATRPRTFPRCSIAGACTRRRRPAISTRSRSSTTRSAAC